MKAKTIFHIDLDSFFVSAERLRNSELRHRAVAVAGEGRRGVVASCSYEARKRGVRSAMPTSQAKALCPELKICPPDIDYYATLSDEIFSSLPHWSPVYEQVSIDEAYLEMTGTENLFGTALQSAHRLRGEVFKAHGLTLSIGIGANRLVAKIATDFAKPNNVYHVLPGSESEFLAPLPVRVIPGCGKVTEQDLHKQSIFTIRDLQQLSLGTLEAHYGKTGAYLYHAARGEGSTEFNQLAKTRSMSRESTFHRDIGDGEKLKKLIWVNVQELASELRRQNLVAQGIRIKLRYPPFVTVLRARALKLRTSNDATLYEEVVKLFEQNWDGSRPLRLLGVGFVLGEPEPQLELFPQMEKTNPFDHEELLKLKDLLHEKYGSDILKTGKDF